MQIQNIRFENLLIFSVLLGNNLIKCTRINSHRSCKNGEFACNSGQCISRNLLCDGILQCYDGSDETAQMCSQTICPAYTFRCNYGACVKISSICNGVTDCIDSSDEPPQNSCKLPYENLGTFPMTSSTKRYTPFLPSGTVTEGTSRMTTKRYTPFNPEGWTQSTPYLTPISKVSEKKTSTISTTPFIIPFNTPSTTPPSDGKCLLPAQSSERTYRINDCQPQSTDSVCNSKPGYFVDFGTVLFFRCASNEFTPAQETFSTYCLEGTWTPPIIECDSCGRLPFDVESGDDIPWQALIRQKSLNEMYCWGSIISPFVIISAAHCFYDEVTGKRKNISDFYVLLGKDVRTFNRNGEHFDIAEIKFSQDGFQGSSTNYGSDIAILEIRPRIQFNINISPVCLDWKRSSDATEETFGIISAFKSVERNGYIKTETVNYESYQNCIQSVSDVLKQVVTMDKLCIINAGIERGNAGKGLYTKRNGEQIYRLRGIFSTSIVDSNQQVLTLTDVTKHLFWINNIVEEINQRRVTEESIDIRFAGSQRIK